MRLGICTPIDRRSAIARATLMVADAIADRAELVLLAEPTEHALATRHPVRPLMQVTPTELRQFDHLITVIGNSGFHTHAVNVARRHSTIVILHDLHLAHLMGGVLTPDELTRELHRWYQPADAAPAVASIGTTRPFWTLEDSMQLGLTEPVLERAAGIVVHSEFARNEIERRAVAPIAVLPLAYRAAASAPDDPLGTVAADPTILTLGHVNKNKRHELVIEALARLEDARARYVIAGPVSEARRHHLLALAQSLGVAPRVELTGALADEEVARLVARASVCVNMRWPSFEGASASLIEQMAAAKAVVVMDGASYAEMPDDAVVKLPPAADSDLLARTLDKLLADNDHRAAVGDAARRHIALHHTAERYATELLDFIDVVESNRPRVDLVHSVIAAANPWAGSAPTSVTYRWADVVDEVLGPAPAPRPHSAVEASDDPGRDADVHGVGRDVADHDAAGADHGRITDGRSRND